MIKVKDVNVAAQKFVTRAQGAAQDYQNGVATAGQQWQANTAASEQTWGDAVTAAVANDRFRKGVVKAGGDKYSRNASTKGAQRYPSGVAGAKDSWVNGTQPYLTAISNMTLPPRRPTGDLANMQRVQMIAQGLRALKMSQ